MISRIPIWVFAIFLALLVLGQRQTRTRLIAPASMAALAIAFFALSLYGVVASFGARPAPLIAWVLGITAAVTLGGSAFGPHGLALVDRSVQVPGSWLPMALMMSIFAVKFGLGFATGMGSPLVRQAWFVATVSLVSGLLSGGFVARALAVHRFARSSRSGG